MFKENDRHHYSQWIQDLCKYPVLDRSSLEEYLRVLDKIKILLESILDRKKDDKQFFSKKITFCLERRFTRNLQRATQEKSKELLEALNEPEMMGIDGKNIFFEEFYELYLDILKQQSSFLRKKITEKPHGPVHKKLLKKNIRQIFNSTKFDKNKISKILSSYQQSLQVIFEHKELPRFEEEITSIIEKLDTNVEPFFLESFFETCQKTQFKLSHEQKKNSVSQNKEKSHSIYPYQWFYPLHQKILAGNNTEEALAFDTILEELQGPENSQDNAHTNSPNEERRGRVRFHNRFSDSLNELLQDTVVDTVPGSDRESSEDNSVEVNSEDERNSSDSEEHRSEQDSEPNEQVEDNEQQIDSAPSSPSLALVRSRAVVPADFLNPDRSSETQSASSSSRQRSSSSSNTQPNSNSVDRNNQSSSASGDTDSQTIRLSVRISGSQRVFSDSFVSFSRFSQACQDLEDIEARERRRALKAFFDLGFIAKAFENQDMTFCDLTSIESFRLVNFANHFKLNFHNQFEFLAELFLNNEYKFLSLAIGENYGEISKECVDEYGRTLFHFLLHDFALGLSFDRKLDFLLKNNFSLKEQDFTGETPLHLFIHQAQEKSFSSRKVCEIFSKILSENQTALFLKNARQQTVLGLLIEKLPQVARSIIFSENNYVDPEKKYELEQEKDQFIEKYALEKNNIALSLNILDCYQRIYRRFNDIEYLCSLYMLQWDKIDHREFFYEDGSDSDLEQKFFNQRLTSSADKDQKKIFEVLGEMIFDSLPKRDSFSLVQLGIKDVFKAKTLKTQSSFSYNTLKKLYLITTQIQESTFFKTKEFCLAKLLQYSHFTLNRTNNETLNSSFLSLIFDVGHLLNDRVLLSQIYTKAVERGLGNKLSLPKPQTRRQGSNQRSRRRIAGDQIVLKHELQKEVLRFFAPKSRRSPDNDCKKVRLN